MFNLQLLWQLFVGHSCYQSVSDMFSLILSEIAPAGHVVQGSYVLFNWFAWELPSVTERRSFVDCIFLVYKVMVKFISISIFVLLRLILFIYIEFFTDLFILQLHLYFVF